MEQHNPIEMTEAQWLAVFPEAKKRHGTLILLRLTTRLLECQQELEGVRLRTAHALRTNKYDWRFDLIKEAGERDTNYWEKEIRTVNSEVRLVKNIGKESTSDAVTDDMIRRARDYPIDKVVEVNRAKFAHCVWHEDTHPSMFCKKNYAHCFSCQRSGDVIDVKMKKEGLSFKDAVIQLQ